MCLLAAIIITGCASAPQYNFSLGNTLSIFLIKNEKDYYFCMPVQYVGDYQIQSFEFVSGNITIGDYNILLNRDEIRISIYLNERANAENLTSDGEFNLIYLEENGIVSVSKMNEPLAEKNDPYYTMNHYYIFIEKYINKSVEQNIINEYEEKRVYSWMMIEFDLVIDNEEQFGSGLIDDFELHDGLIQDTSWYPANLDFFKAKHLHPAAQN